MLTIQDFHKDEIEGLIGRVLGPTGAGKLRRDEFRLRMLALTERHEELVKLRTRELFNQNAIIAEVNRYARSIFNPFRKIAKRLAVAYKTTPNRRLEGEGKGVNRQFHQMLRRTQFNRHAKIVNELQVTMNTIVVLARAARLPDGRPIPDFDFVTGADGEVLLDPDAPFRSVPAVLAYPLHDRDSRLLWEMQPQPADAEVVATVDARWWIYWNARREPVRAIEHGFGRFPGAVVRGTMPMGRTMDDWWDPWTGRAVTQTVADVGVAGATMAWTRKTQFGHLITILRNSDNAGPGDETEGEGDQVLGHPESVLELDGEAVQLIVNDIDKSIRNFREHMEFLTAEGAEALAGGAGLLSDPQPGQVVPDLQIAGRHAMLRERQEDQIDGLSLFEDEFLPLLAQMATVIRSPWAVSPSAVEDNLVTEFAALPWLDTPENRLKYHVEATKFGISDQIEAYRERHDVDEETAEERVLALAERRGRLHKIMAEHNRPADPAQEPGAEPDPSMPGERPEAATGRAGGRARPPSQPSV